MKQRDKYRKEIKRFITQKWRKEINTEKKQIDQYRDKEKRSIQKRSKETNIEVSKREQHIKEAIKPIQKWSKEKYTGMKQKDKYREVARLQINLRAITIHWRITNFGLTNNYSIN